MQYGKYIYLGNRNAFSLKKEMRAYLCLLLFTMFLCNIINLEQSHERNRGD